MFSRRTIGEFEDASASIPLRPLDRIFQGADVRLAEDPGGIDGARRVQFRRYVASVDQHDPQQLDRLGNALGALIAEVAASKQQFLIAAAERDGFFFADGAFRPAAAIPSSFAVTRVEDLSLIDDRGKRLHRLAIDSPGDAIGGAKELVESVCRTVLRLASESASRGTVELAAIAASTLSILELKSPSELIPAQSIPSELIAPELPRAGSFDSKVGSGIIRLCLQQLGAVVARFDELRNVYASGVGREGSGNGLSSRHARLAVGAAVAFASFVAETYEQQAALKTCDAAKTL